MAGKMEELGRPVESLKEKVEQEKTANKKFQRERDVLMKELKRLREDTGTVDNLKKKLEQLKKN
jgi:predicted RNase H-like nuclease (RuvC/YqgF family)